MILDHIKTNVCVEPETNCWTWLGASCGTRNGKNRYGNITIERQSKKVHRLVYELTKGPIPEGMELDHLCRNTLCCNPDHLEPVPHSTNCQRGQTGHYNTEKTHCPQGHEYTPENIRWNGTRRICRTCANRRTRSWMARNPEKKRVAKWRSYRKKKLEKLLQG